MASTYTVNIGIEKPGTGDQSGTWGNTTNTNFDIIDQATNGVATVTLAAAGTSGSPNTLLINNGALSDGRNRFIEFNDGADLGATAYVQLDPNDAEKIVHIRNSLSASRSLILFQGTYNASNDFEVPNGADVLVKFDGGGTGATVTDVNVNLTPTKVTTGDLDVDNININGNTISSTDTNGNLTIDPNGTGNIVLDANVGIGTSSPAFVTGSGLEIKRAGAATLRLEDTGSGGKPLEIYSDDGEGYVINGVSAGMPMIFKNNNTERMRIDTSANVGIGSSVTALFNGVGGSMKLVVTGDDSTTAITNNSDAGIAIVNTNQTAGNLAGLHFARADTDDNPNYAGASIVAQFPEAQVTGQYPKGELAFLTSTATNSSPSEKMRIASSGNVGIGTTSPATSYGNVLQIHDTGTSGANLRLTDSTSGAGTGNGFEIIQIGADNYIINRENGFIATYNNGSERMRIDSSGRVGIGRTPTITNSKLEVGGADNVSLINVEASGNTGGIGIGSSGLQLFHGSSSKVTITSAGNVGIGTTSPTSPLHVATTSQIVGTFISTGADPQVYIGDAATADNAFILGYDRADNRGYLTVAGDGDDVFTIADGGTVGIGTTSPIAQSKLTVAGSSLSITGADVNFGAGGVRGMLDLASGYLRIGALNGGGSANGIKLVTPAGGDAVVVDSSGRLLIGTTVHSISSSQKFEVQGGIAAFQFNDNSSSPVIIKNNNSVAGNGVPSIVLQDSSGNRGGIYRNSSNDVGLHGQGAVTFHTGGTAPTTERVRIDSSGNLQLGYGGQTTTAFAAPQGITIASLDNVAIQHFLRKGNQVEAHIGFKSSTDTNFYVGTGGGPGPGGIGVYGVYQANNATSWSAVSDETQKTIVGNIENASEKVSTLRTVMGYYNTDETESHKPFLIAQDVQAVLPEAVSIADVETGILGLSYTDVIPLLTAAIKEQRTMIQELEARIAALEAN